MLVGMAVVISRGTGSSAGKVGAYAQDTSTQNVMQYISMNNTKY